MRRIIAIILILTCVTAMTACGRAGAGGDNMENVDFTVVDRGDIPQQLSDTIEERREAEFEISANIDGYTYLAKGYGQQATGGYSIRVDELKSDGKEMVFKTTLIGPSAGEAVNKLATYPYIVIKTELTEDNISFD